MNDKLNPDPFNALGKHWEKTQELFTTWSKAAGEFWDAYLEFVSLLGHRNDTNKR